MDLNVVATATNEAATNGATTNGATANPPATNGVADDRRALAEAVVEELTGWGPKDRHGAFRRWHRGAFSLVHLNVLTALEAEGPLAMSRLAEALDVSVASATGIVDRMERRGLVQRRHDTEDRRVVLVLPTAPGAAVFHDLEARRRDRLTRLLGELTDEELAGFLRGVRALRVARARLDEPSEGEGAPGDPIQARATVGTANR